MRPFAIIFEILILIGILYCLLLSIRLTVIDIGFDPRYDRFVKWTFRVIGAAISAFFVAHLILFYPKFLP